MFAPRTKRFDRGAINDYAAGGRSIDVDEYRVIFALVEFKFVGKGPEIKQQLAGVGMAGEIEGFAKFRRYFRRVFTVVHRNENQQFDSV